jgi:hypothetical protein
MDGRFWFGQQSQVKEKMAQAAGTLAWHEGKAKWLHTDQINIY